MRRESTHLRLAMLRLGACLALLAASVAPLAAQPAPAFDLGVLLDTHFWPQNSSFSLASPADDFLLFPPTGFAEEQVEGHYRLRAADGREVESVGLWYKGRTDTPAVVEVFSRGQSLVVPGAGSYVLEAEVDGATVASIPFTATVEGTGDPFAPTPSTRLEGPWRTHGYFIHRLDQPEGVMEFHTWIRRDEPAGQQTSEVSIRRDGREIAWGRGSANGSNQAWLRVEYHLYLPEGRDRFGVVGARAPNWTVQDVTPGTYEIVLSTQDGPFRTMTVEGGAGAFVPHARSAVDYEPRAQYLTPRRMTGQSLHQPAQLYWVGPDAM